jgi:hypothetical protein
MKKYRPYTKFPDDIVGKVVRMNCDVCTVTYLFGRYNKVAIGAKTLTPEDAFKECAFLDGTPVGEEYEEVAELEFDKVYLVRSHGRDYWKARFFSRRVKDAFLFYDCGTSSKTTRFESSVTPWSQVCDYNKEMVDERTEPAEYLIKQN